ncbi:MAG: hypothetical protein B7Y25_05515 [Alphaproteobacteria bacterium 16-39-46]|nr:MAG: hypothetical protein B7Y25_05515 [Alphaproteobacteria bacterium 16-39-46]OZA44273.1 MAG: hypothetical protein B7X84_00845 [Alphaproteobacteria bacterium 17-39-52]HQS84372.1 hypothetical protein [Alphaproteobacteria bacterium]
MDSENGFNASNTDIKDLEHAQRQNLSSLLGLQNTQALQQSSQQLSILNKVTNPQVRAELLAALSKGDTNLFNLIAKRALELH